MIDFLQALYRGVDCGYVEFRPATAPSVFIPLPLDVERAERHAAWLEGRTTPQPYYGVAPRLEPTHGRADNCFAVTTLVADCDFKRHRPADVWEALCDHPFQPSAIVSTGGGLHVYWFLDQPLYDTERGQRLLTRWGATVPLSDPVFDLPRVLRLPGSLNRKYDPPRRATLEVFDPDCRYAPDALEDYLGSLPATPEATATIAQVRTYTPVEVPEMVDAGERHAWLFRMLRSLRAKYNFGFEELHGMLSVLNESRCEPPLSERELRPFLHRAFHTPHSREFQQ